ncbi:MAG: ROK family protein [Planctomycetota bacterium]|jgi:glucokinase
MGKWCIGIDLGGTYIKFLAVGEDRRAGKPLQLPTPADGGAEAVAAQMVAGVREAMSASGVAAGDVLGVGIGSPGPLKISEGIVVATPNIPGMENAPLVKMVGDGLGVRAVLENDANAAALGEYLYGAGRGGSMVLLTLGTGVGSGIVLDGRILHGSHEMGAELGHLIMVPGGEQCGCGQRGCLERYCSAAAVARLAARRLEEPDCRSSLRELVSRKGSLDARDINEARRAGDKLAAEIWDHCVYYLALGCVSICRIFDPDDIVLSGGMTKAGDDLMAPLMDHFNRLHWSIARPLTRISLARLGNDAGAIGAAAVAWQAFGKSWPAAGNR